MDKLKFIIIAALCIPYFSFSQIEVQEGEIQWLHAIKKEPYKKIDGSPYYFDWGKGKITLKDGTEYPNLNLNYDIYKSLIHVKNESQGLIAVHTELITEVRMTSGRVNYHFKPFKSEEVGLSKNQGGDIYTRFYEVIHEGEKYGYYKLPIKAYQNDETLTSDKAYDTNETTGHLDYRQKHFLRLPSGEFKTVPPRKKAFLSALSDHSNLLKDYIKKEKPIFKQPNDIHKMLQFLEMNTN